MTSGHASTWVCTCGSYLVSASHLPERCPGCGAEQLRNDAALDSAAPPWEEIDVRDRMYGVFLAEGETPSPVILTRDARTCEDWIGWQRSRGDDCQFGSCDVCVMPVDRVSGIAWNDLSAPPAPWSPWPAPLEPAVPSSESVGTIGAEEAARRAEVRIACSRAAGSVARFSAGMVPLFMAGPVIACRALEQAGVDLPGVSWAAIYLLASLVACALVDRAYLRAVKAEGST